MTDKNSDGQTNRDGQKILPPPGAHNNRFRILQILWQAPTMTGTLHRKIQNPSWISLYFIGIFQNHDGQNSDGQTHIPPPVTQTNRGRILQI